MNKKIELLAPGGDVESIKAAIVAGADAIYCGLDKFNARKKAANISFENLHGILRLANEHNCKIFLTLNIIILESEISAVFKLLNQLVNTGIDGVIVQDIGLFYLLSNYFPTLDVHASTQVTTHNDGQIKFLGRLGVSRVNLSRELSIHEIKSLTHTAHEQNILAEVFVHGSNCIGFSGLCYFSSVQGGNSGNRGQCSQPCRDQYQTTSAGSDFPLNLKDNSLFSDLPILIDAGVDSLKVEGRIKKSHYVYTVISAWRKQIQDYFEHEHICDDKHDLYQVFNRDFSNAYVRGEIGRNMYIDNPRDNALNYFTRAKKCATENEVQSVKQELYDAKTNIITTLSEKISSLSIEKTSLGIEISGKRNSSLNVRVSTPGGTFIVRSKSRLIDADKYTIDQSSIEKRLKSLNNAQFHLEKLDFSNLQPGLFVPFKELSTIKNRILFLLNDSRECVSPIEKPKLSKCDKIEGKPTLSILISSEKDVELSSKTSAKIYYQLPDSINSEYRKLVKLFSNNTDLIPWFSSVIIGDDYNAAVELLKKIRPKQIVTNNTGIAYQACKNDIQWVAGPYLNVTNSFSLLCMKERFNCSGSFISNEINRRQIEHVVRPDNFKLCYSIYHPIMLLSSRQCLFHQTTGCKKEYIDRKCLPKCKKSTSIVNLKDTRIFIDKQKSEYNCMYSRFNYLNTDILADLPDMFSEYFIDLRDVRTETKTGKTKDKASMVKLFENLMGEKDHAKHALEQVIYPTINTQYSKGL